MIVACCLILLAAADGPPAPARRPDAAIRLPADPEVVVLTFDRVGGGPAIPRLHPLLTIRAGGRVTVNGPVADGGREGSIGQADLERLLRFAAEDCRVFDFDERRLRETIKRRLDAHELVQASDADHTEIRIKTADREKLVLELPVSPVWGKGWPADPDLDLMLGLDRLERRLVNLTSRIQLGGDPGVSAAVLLANEQLRLARPTAPPLTADDLGWTGSRFDGAVEITFQRIEPGGKPLVVVIVRPPVGEPTVTVQDG